MIFQIALVVLVAAFFFRPVRRLLRTTVGLILGALVLFLVVVAITQAG